MYKQNKKIIQSFINKLRLTHNELNLSNVIFLKSSVEINLQTLKINKCTYLPLFFELPKFNINNIESLIFFSKLNDSNLYIFYYKKENTDKHLNGYKNELKQFDYNNFNKLKELWINNKK